MITTKIHMFATMQKLASTNLFAKDLITTKITNNFLQKSQTITIKIHMFANNANWPSKI
jgi:hypothetical protein